MSTSVEINNNKQQQKGNNLNPKLKLTIRHLPPTLPEEVFKDSIKPYLTDEKDIIDQSYVPGKVSKKLLTPSRPSVEFKIQIIFSPVQQTKKNDTKLDTKLNTLETDPEFIKFCNKIKNEGDKACSGTYTEQNSGSQDLDSTDSGKKSTPLLDYLKAKKIQKASKGKFKSSSALKGENSQSERSKSGKKSKKEKLTKQSTNEEASTSSKPPKASKLKKKKAKTSEEKNSDSKDSQSKALKGFTVAKNSDSATPSPQFEKVSIAKRQDSLISSQGEKTTTVNYIYKLTQRSDKSSPKPTEVEGSRNPITSIEKSSTARRSKKGKTFHSDQGTGVKQGNKSIDESSIAQNSSFPTKKGKKASNSPTPAIIGKPVFTKSGASGNIQQSSDSNSLNSPHQINNSQDTTPRKIDSFTELPNNSNSEIGIDKTGVDSQSGSSVFNSKSKPKSKTKASRPKGSIDNSRFDSAENSSNAASNSSGFKLPTESPESGSTTITTTKPIFKKQAYKLGNETVGGPFGSRGSKPPKTRDTATRFGSKPTQGEDGQDTLKSKPKKNRPKPVKSVTGSSNDPQPSA